MAYRTTEDAVKGILGGNYDTVAAPSLAPFLRSANVLTNRLYTAAVEESLEVSTAELAEIECYLAAHFYMQSDKGYAARSNLSASATFQGQTGKGLESSDYGQQAMLLDPTGFLTDAGKTVNVGAFWGGTRYSNQRTAEERE